MYVAHLENSISDLSSDAASPEVLGPPGNNIPHTITGYYTPTLNSRTTHTCALVFVFQQENDQSRLPKQYFVLAYSDYQLRTIPGTGCYVSSIST